MKNDYKKFIIYKVTNKINGKIYIGATTRDLKIRKSEHERGDKTVFDRAISKYGKENFEWEIIDESSTTYLELQEKEIFYISFYDSRKNGYNITNGGELLAGVSKTEEHRKKISESNKKNKKTANYGEKNGMFGKHRTEEEKEHLRKCFSGSSSIKSKKYVIVAPDGNVIDVDGLNFFCKNYKNEKLHPPCLINCAKGYRKHHKGFMCFYSDEFYKIILLLPIFNNEIV